MTFDDVQTFFAKAHTITALKKLLVAPTVVGQCLVTDGPSFQLTVGPNGVSVEALFHPLEHVITLEGASAMWERLMRAESDVTTEFAEGHLWIGALATARGDAARLIQTIRLCQGLSFWEKPGFVRVG